MSARDARPLPGSASPRIATSRPATLTLLSPLFSNPTWIADGSASCRRAVHCVVFARQQSPERSPGAMTRLGFGRDRPGAVVILGPERPAGMDGQHLGGGVGQAVKKDAGAALGHGQSCELGPWMPRSSLGMTCGRGARQRRQKVRCGARSSSSISGKGPTTSIGFWPEPRTVRAARLMVGFSGWSPVSARSFASSKP